MSLWKYALGCCLLFAGVQGVWAQGQQSQNPITCKGTVYFKAPDDWTTAYIGGKNVQFTRKMTLNADGFYEYDLEGLGITDNQSPFFAIGNQASVNATFQGVTSTAFAVTPLNTNDNSWFINNASLRCPGEGEHVYVTENPNSPGKTFTGKYPPGAKYFFVMIPPEMEDWMSAVPMISFDGGLTGSPMTAVNDMCGWYSYVFVGQDISDNVVLYRDDDLERADMIGVNGNWEEEDQAQPIPLGFLLNMVDSLFFVPDEEQKGDSPDGYFYSKAEVGGIEGTCSYTMAAIIYDSDASLHPAFSCYKDGGGEGCQNGALGIAATTAQQLVNACIGVTSGLVESKLDPSVPQSQRKPKLSTKGKNCFIDDSYFGMLFNYTPGVNEKSCFDMPFKRAKDGKWEFDSDYYTSPGLTVPGGFYPVENTTDASILLADPNQVPVAAARTKRTAEGPVFYSSPLRKINAAEDMPEIDILCNGPGWNKGRDCETLFADGTGTDAELSPKFGQCIFGWSCKADAPEDWAFFVSGTETPAARSDANEPRWKSVETANGKGGRNQQFCFESHAKFTFKPGLKFNFRGDDDIWVFIDNTLAVDLGGTHLAAPGYVDLDSFKGYNGQNLVVGNTYDLDIFFCDRRTTMSNVRIKTNMYIMQKTAIEVKGKKNPTNPAETIYDHLCFTVTSDGSCAAAMTGTEDGATYCGIEILESGRIPSYTLVNGKKITENVVPGFENVNVQGVYKCGIDLTNLVEPKVDKSSTCLPGGYYTLFVTIDGKSQKVMSFKTTGEVDVLYKNGNAISVDEETGDVVQKGKYNVETIAMGGEMIPIYVSNVAPGTDSDDLEIFPDDAAGMEYTLAYNNMMTVYRKVVDPTTGAEAYQKLHSGEKQTIGPAGIDTLYATVDMENLQQPITPFEISVSGRPTPLTLYFYLPQITFIESIPETEDEVAVPVKGQTPKADGSYDENWVGTIYDMYLAILVPDLDGTYSICTEKCNGVAIHKGSETSPKIDFMWDEGQTEAYFVNGYTKISIRSVTKYRWDTDPSIHSPASIVAEYNDFVKAVYSPMYFRDPPVPFPVLADVFDARGSLPTLEHAIPSPYFSMQQEYLDGIGDSVAIYYDRRIHKDSLPSKICVMWDSTTAEFHNPYQEKISTMPKDSAITCNALVSLDASNIDCSAPSDSGYCTNIIMVGGLTLSEKVKTSGIGMVHSFAAFEDKGKAVKQGFSGKLTDRMAPVPLRAEVRTLKNGDDLTDYDSLVVVMSEPVKLVTSSNKKQALDFYLNSAIELAESNRYVSALGDGSSVVTAQSDPALGTDAKTGEGRIKYMYLRGSVSPHVGDYVRLAGDMSNVFWSDTTDINALAADAASMRSADDAGYHWNSPTAYNETKRVPSMWVPVVGDAEIAVDEIKYASTANVPSSEKTPAVSVNVYRTTKTKAEIWAEEGGRPGHLVKADMYALYNGLTPEERASILPQDVFFYFEVQYYTNLGNFVASKTAKIYCDDNKNTEINPETGERIQYFGGGLCTDAGNDRNFYIGWNMRSDNGRQVGTGAYIVKLKSYVRLGSAGKRAKQESTSVWGVRRSPKPDTGYMKAVAE
ncbi:fibro-slime domain-containing protein [Fibrobacter sp. UWB5]|uniref:fibro-slime domain-containing protein n=1 Tax=Fibrobacter sp. UWB5 TaxID=1964360 RepID=UPI001E511798|nr:fibro-slime domain-containing protein [Fibrobacter sp. UWB5]